jgi:predicted amidohydrolase
MRLFEVVVWRNPWHGCPPARDLRARQCHAMKIHALELPAKFGDPGGQLALIRAALAREAADLVVLQECALTGYVSPELGFDLRPFAEPLEGATVGACRTLAREHGIHLVAPLIEESEGVYFNSSVVLGPGGELVAHYRKRHPWFPETWATKGTFPYPELEINGLRLTLAVCYDLHFLAEAADTLARADVLLFPSAWVDDGDTDLRAELFGALVRRFGLTVVNANWGEGEPQLPGQGRSRIVSPAGVVEAPRLPGRVSSAVAEVFPKRRSP